MKDCEISINQLAEFSEATPKRKTKIVENQITPNPVLLPWYQLAKARIKQSIEQQGDLAPISDGISRLVNQEPEKDWQKHNKFGSIEALQRFVAMKLPSVLKGVDYEILRPKQRQYLINGVLIKVAPEVVVRASVNGRTLIGGFKIHIKKKHFSLQQSKLVANIMYRYLSEVVAKKDEEVLPEYCFCMDVFAERILPANRNEAEKLDTVHGLCDQIKEIWNGIQISN